MPTLERAIMIASIAHIGQVDKGGHPYILHVLRVIAACPPGDAQIVAALHDVIEDGEKWSTTRLDREGFMPDVIRAVDLLTKPKQVAYRAYIDAIAQNNLARIVKIEDLKDNMDMSRLATITMADAERRNKYAWALERLRLSFDNDRGTLYDSLNQPQT